MVILHIKFIGTTKCSNMVANILPAYSPPDPSGQKVKILLFSEQCHVAYQIKGNQECSNIVANILYAHPLHTLGMGSISQKSTFSEHGHIAYQFKGNQHGCNMDEIVQVILFLLN